jgi:hypothetical protein
MVYKWAQNTQRRGNAKKCKKKCIMLVYYTNTIQDARSTKHKKHIKRSHNWKLAVNTMKYLRASLKPPGKFNFTEQ